MKFLGFTILFWLINITYGFGQIVNKENIKVPRSIAKSTNKLAKFLTENDTSEFQKVFNIYAWITNNIRYDVRALCKVKSKLYYSKKTLRKKKGICYQYSDLFNILCQNAGIKSKEILGYSRGSSYHENDRFYETDHSWNGVRIDSSWYLVDATWGSGYLIQRNQWFKKILFKWFKKPYINNRYKFFKNSNNQYFLISPDSLIANHLPANPVWQLIEFPVSINTFESKDWTSYTAKIDSSYLKQIDTDEYLRKINKYTYLPKLQYLKSTAESAFEFNSRNTRLLGFAYYNFGKSLGLLSSSIKAKRSAIKNYTLAIKYLKKHQKTVNYESNKMSKKLNSRISTELKKPLSKRIIKGQRDVKETSKLLISSQKNQILRNEKIAKLESKIAIGLPSFKKPNTLKTKRKDVSQKTFSIIEKKFLEVSTYQDSVNVIINQVLGLNEKRKIIQNKILDQYQKLPSLSLSNINSIRENTFFSKISESMSILDSIGMIIDSLSLNRRNIKRAINQKEAIVKRLNSFILSSSKEIQNLALQNCSQNLICNESDYDSANYIIKSVYRTQLKLENELLYFVKQDDKSNTILKKRITELLDTLEINKKFIALFEEIRLKEITFKMRKSNFQTSRLIEESQKAITSLKKEIVVLNQKISREKN